jgi:hypothetical protein
VADDATTWIRRVADREREQRGRIAGLEAELDEYRRLIWPEAPPQCRIGVLGSFTMGSLESSLAVPVLLAELGRRIAGVDVRMLTTSETSGALVETIEPAEPLGDLDDSRLANLAASIDLIVTLDDEADRRMHGVATRYGPAVLRAVDDCPPLEVLLPRVFSRSDLTQRHDMLRAEGRAPGGPLVCALVGSDLLADTVDEARRLARLRRPEHGDCAAYSATTRFFERQSRSPMDGPSTAASRTRSSTADR